MIKHHDPLKVGFYGRPSIVLKSGILGEHTLRHAYDKLAENDGMPPKWTSIPQNYSTW